MIEKIVATPYTDRESVRWLVRYMAGSPIKSAGIAPGASSPCVLNEGVTCRHRLAVIGDIMGMRGHRLVIQDALKEFTSDSDCLIGNLEGTITAKRAAIWPISFNERHDTAIAETLAGLFPARKTYLCVSNNHAGDFGKEEFSGSIRTLESKGFNVFGWRDKPYIDINDNMRVVSGTMWSNRKCDYLATLETAEDFAKQGAFSLLYPHMGYEFESSPRPEIVRVAKRAVSIFDAVIAHHPHWPQPVMSEKAGPGSRLLAYSLGDFCCGLRKRLWRYGIVMKMEIGQDHAGKWLAGKVEWRPTECVMMPDGRFLVKISDPDPEDRI
jgi:poly-gamma-glutamate synthesis protein (capsule biosynthesis protein)